MARGHTLSKRSGEIVAADLRKRRWDYTPEKVHHNRNARPNELIHVKTKAACGSRNGTTGAMSAVSCDRYNVAPGGTVTDSNEDITVLNPFNVSVPSGSWCDVLLNEAGEYEFVVVPRATPQTFDVRVKPDGTALQKSTDGGITWVDWATIGTC